MSKQANKTAIGAFVIIGLVLVVGAVVVFGSGKFFSETRYWVMYFDGSVKGLSLGAPVELQGVKVGSVTDIGLEFDIANLTFRTRVDAETVGGRISPVGGQAALDAYLAKFPGEDAEEVREDVNEMLIARGMKAQLELQSMVTGQLMVSLDFFPDKPIKLIGDVPEGYMEIPTIPTMMEQLEQTLKDLPIKEIVDDLHGSIQSLDKILSSEQTKQTLVNLDGAMEHMNALLSKLDEQADPLGSRVREMVEDITKLVNDIDGQVEPVSTSLTGTLDDTRKLVNNIDEEVQPLTDNFNEALTDARKLVNNVDGHLEEMKPGLQAAVKAAEEALEKTTETLALLQGLAPEDSALVHEIRSTLKSLTDAMDSLKSLADTLERQPEALLKGK
ncbi:MAG: MlaD family protein [Planctomycetota bacterium]|jgi:paraquat-inducible protein B